MVIRRAVRHLLLGAGAILLCVPGTSVAQTTYLAFGDSITEGLGDENASEAGAGYPIRLEGLLPGSIVINQGLGAEKTPEGVTRIDSVLANNPADVLLLMEGTNDVTQRTQISEETTFFNLNQMAIKAENAGLEVYHATVIPRPPTANRDSENYFTQSTNQGIRDLAMDQGRHLVDNFEILLEQPNVYDTLYSPEHGNVGHPNAAGYDVIAQTFADEIDGLDRVPPVPSDISPRSGRENVPASATIVVEVVDFGAGIDLATGVLSINGEATPAGLAGTESRARFSYSPSEPLAGQVSVSMTISDLAVPPNTYDREVARYTIEGFDPDATGDVDGDGRVDGIDLIALAVAFGSRSGESRYDRRADFDRNSAVDGSDLAVLAANFGSTVTD